MLIWPSINAKVKLAAVRIFNINACIMKLCHSEIKNVVGQ